MKKTLLLLAVLCAQLTAMAEKTVYIPNEWRNPWPADSLLYAENDPENKYTWSKSRSVESDNVIIFWDKYYGNTKPQDLPKSDWNYVDIPDLLQKCESFYDIEINKLGFVDPETSNLSKYKVMVLMNFSKRGDWACYGGGYDFMVSALWLNSATCKPVGFSVAHEVGHSFHYMCFAEHSGHHDSETDNTGFHLACGNGQAIWEQTAQWQATQSYPEEMFSQSIGMFRNTHNYAFSHEWHRYQSYWFHYYINQKYNDITSVAQVWNQPMTGQSKGNGSDFNEALMALKDLSANDLYKMYFDYACHLVTWDIDACKPYSDYYIGDFRYAASEIGDSTYQVAYSSCPQGTGFNVIPLQLKPAGTQISTHFTAMRPISRLADADPREYHNGDGFVTLPSTKTTYNGQNSSYRGFRLGYVVLKEDGTREYFSEDEVYCTGSGEKSVDYGFTVPEGAKQMWLVVSPALSKYIRHKWDENVANDDQWPYYFKLSGTDIGSSAIVYSPIIIDGRPIGNIDIEYNVSFPARNSYEGAAFYVSGKALAMFGTAFQMANPASDVYACIQPWSSSAPEEGTCKFYACNPTSGIVNNASSTTNGYGHWFNTNGIRCTWGDSDSKLYSDFLPSVMAFDIGQYPGKLEAGDSFRIAQALRYKKDGIIRKATFYFNVNITNGTESNELVSVKYDDPTITGMDSIEEEDTTEEDENWYSLDGRIYTEKPEQKGVFLHKKKKFLIGY